MYNLLALRLAVMIPNVLTANVFLLGVVLAAPLLGQAAPPAGDDAPSARVSLPIDERQVVIRDERFRGSKVDLPQLASVDFRLDARPLPAGTAPEPPKLIDITYLHPAHKAMYDFEFGQDPATRKYVLRFVPRVYELGIAGPSGVTLPSEAAELELEYQRDSGNWRPAPAAAYRWTPGRGEGKLAVLPAALEPEMPALRIRLRARSLLRWQEATLGTDKAITLAGNPKEPDLSATPVTKYPLLLKQGRAVWRSTFVETRQLWTRGSGNRRDASDTLVYVVPGFQPLYAQEATESGLRIEVYTFNPDPYKSWSDKVPAELMEPLSLEATIALNPPKAFAATAIRAEPSELEVLIRDRVIHKSPARLIGGKWTASLPLPELYEKAAKDAAIRGLSEEAGFEELETKSALRLVFSGGGYIGATAASLTVPIEKAAPGISHSLFGLEPPQMVVKKVKIPGVGDVDVASKVPSPTHRDVQVDLTLPVVEAQLAGPDGADPASAIGDPGKWNARFSVRALNGSWLAIPAEAVSWKPSLQSVEIFPAGVAGKLSGDFRVETDLFEPEEFAIKPGAPTPTVKLRPAGIPVRLPMLLADAKPTLLVSSETGEPGKSESLKTDTQLISLSTLPEQVIPKSLIAVPLKDAYMELRVPGHRPLVVTRYRGGELDGRKLEPVKPTDKPFVVLINNWTEFTSTNNENDDNIRELQKQTVRLLSDTLSKSTRMAGLAIVEPGKGKWPEGDAEAALLRFEKEPPLPMQPRHRGLPDELWSRLRRVLTTREIVEQHEVIRVIVVGPYQLQLTDKPEHPLRKWLDDRVKLGAVKVANVVLGGPEVRETKAVKQYPGLHLVKVSGNKIFLKSDDSDGQDVAVLSKWLEDEVVTKLFRN